MPRHTPPAEEAPRQFQDAGTLVEAARSASSRKDLRRALIALTRAGCAQVVDPAGNEAVLAAVEQRRAQISLNARPAQMPKPTPDTSPYNEDNWTSTSALGPEWQEQTDPIDGITQDIRMMQQPQRDRE